MIVTLARSEWSDFIQPRQYVVEPPGLVEVVVRAVAVVIETVKFMWGW